MECYMDIERIIESIEGRGHNLYRDDGEAADRLAWEVGALRSKLRELWQQIEALKNERL